IESTLYVTGLPSARRIRATSLPKVVIGGYLGHLWRALRVPFELTPLLSLPFVAAAAWFLYAGPVWLGVLCAWFHAANDIADGVAMGLEIDPLPEDRRPRA